MSLNYYTVNIGLEIQAYLNFHGLTKADLARKLGRHRQYIQALLKKSSMDTNELIAISIALNYNFFKFYEPYNELNNPSAEYKREYEAKADKFKTLLEALTKSTEIVTSLLVNEVPSKKQKEILAANSHGQTTI